MRHGQLPGFEVLLARPGSLLPGATREAIDAMAAVAAVFWSLGRPEPELESVQPT